MSDRVLALVAHPDDETFGCGGTLARHAKSGDDVGVVVFADGLGSRGPVTSSAIATRHGALRRACKILGTENVFIHQYADNQMDTLALLTVVKHIEVHLQRFKPTVVYTHWRGDLNVDHRVMHDAVNVACRPQPGCTIKRLAYFEIPCSTAWGGEFEPDYFVDVSSTIDVKNAAIECYPEELREYPHPRSLSAIGALAMRRGSQVGLHAAEAFKIGRLVE